MDQESKRIDDEYQEILKAEKRVQSLAKNAEIVKEYGVDITGLLANVAAEREKVNRLRAKQAEDFFLLNDSRMIDVLRMRYVEDQPWADIADEINYSMSHTKELRNRALKIISEKRKNSIL